MHGILGLSELLTQFFAGSVGATSPRLRSRPSAPRLQEPAPGPPTPAFAQQYEYCVAIRECATLLQSLVNSVLDFSKVRVPCVRCLSLQRLLYNPHPLSTQIDAGLMLLERIAIDLPRITERVLVLMRAGAVDRGIRLTLDISPGLPGVLYGDSLRIQQVVGMRRVHDSSVLLCSPGFPPTHAPSLRFWSTSSLMRSSSARGLSEEVSS